MLRHGILMPTLTNRIPQGHAALWRCAEQRRDGAMGPQAKRGIKQRVNSGKNCAVIPGQQQQIRQQFHVARALLDADHAIDFTHMRASKAGEQ